MRLKALSTLLFGLMASSAFGFAPLDPGTWTGTGEWKADDGTKGTYQVTKVISGDSVKVTYDFGNNNKMTSDVKVVDSGNGFFKFEGIESLGSCFDKKCTVKFTTTKTDGTVMNIHESCFIKEDKGAKVVQSVGLKSLKAADGSVKNKAFQEKLTLQTAAKP